MSTDQYPCTTRLRSRAGLRHGTSGKRAFVVSDTSVAGLPERGEVPQQGIAPQAIAVDCGGGTSGDDALSLLGRVDHLAQQEKVTLHRRAWPRPAPLH